MTQQVLVVDDEKNIRQLIQRILTSQGYHVLTAADGAEAKGLLDKGQFTVGCIDIHIPGADGMNVLAYAMERDKYFKGIMITGESSVEIAHQAGMIGAFRYLQKPFERADLLSIVAEAFEQREKDESTGPFQREKILLTRHLQGISMLAEIIRHDLNNSLLAIGGHALVSLEQYGSVLPEDVRVSLDKIVKGSDRASMLTKQLQNVVKQGIYSVQDINRVAQETASLLRAVFYQKSHEILTDCSAKHYVWGDDTQLYQLMLNLLVNAHDATVGKGRIMLRTRDAVLKREQGHLRQIKPGEYVVLSVTDYGRGIDKKVQSKMFDRFYTTKSDGTGTGLYLVKAVAEMHNAQIDVETALQRGSTFYVYFPVYRGTEKKR